MLNVTAYIKYVKEKRERDREREQKREIVKSNVNTDDLIIKSDGQTVFWGNRMTNELLEHTAIPLHLDAMMSGASSRTISSITTTAKNRKKKNDKMEN